MVRGILLELGDVSNKSGLGRKQFQATELGDGVIIEKPWVTTYDRPV